MGAFSEYIKISREISVSNIIYLLMQPNTTEDSIEYLAFGLGIIINGDIYHGDNNKAGEFNESLMHYQFKHKKNENTAENQMSYNELSLARLNNLAKSDDEYAHKLLEDIVGIITDLLSLSVSILDPGITLIHYDSEMLDPVFIEMLTNMVKKRLTQLQDDEPLIRCSSLQMTSVAYGAAQMMLETLFYVPEIKKTPIYEKK